MKKVLLAILVLVILILATAVALPIVFKDDIQAAVDEEIGKNVRAKVFYDTDHFNLTLFKNFPNITAGLGDFGIVGIDPFEGDTLMSMGSFEVVVDIMSVINGEQIKVNSISLVEPEIYVVVLADGTANYDIAVESDEVIEEDPSADTTTTAFNVAIDHWEIVNGNLIYYDQSMDFYTTIFGLNHRGEGDFTQDLFDLKTITTIDSWSMGFEGEDYLSDRRLMVDLTLAMDLPNATYTFKENRIALNDFGFGFDGTIAMPGEDINLDLTFGGRDITLVSILSLIPGAYQEYLNGLEANANINFGGFVKGTYNEKQMPAINAKLKVDEGSIRYSEYPIPIEQLTIDTEFDAPSENLRKARFDVNKFSMLLDGEQIEAQLMVKNFKNYRWKFSMDGNLDLGKLTKIVPMDSMELRGKINATLQTSGKMSDLEAERYDLLPTSGTMAIRDFNFTSPDLPQGFGISESDASFDPSSVQLKSFNATLGKSDMQMNGSLSNYLGYVLSENEVIQGELNFTSNSFDLNEWMTEEETTETEIEEDTAALTVVEVPTNIDFTLRSSIKEILYDNMSIKDLRGDILIKDGIVTMSGLKFNLLNGTFGMDGFYSTVNKETPEFDFSLSIEELSIAQSFKTFNTIQTLAPIAEKMTGNFSTQFNIGGALGRDMMPLYDQLHGKGLVEIAQAAFKGDMKLMTAINGATKLTKLSGSETTTDQISLKDVIMQAEIKDGRVHLQPFNLIFGGYETTISGSNGVDGSLDYTMGMNLPTGQMASAVNSLLASQLGGSNYVGDKVQLNLGVGGTYEDPKVRVLSAKNVGGSSPADAAKAAVAAEVERRKKEAEAQAKRELERQEARARREAERAAAKAKQEADEAAKKASQKVEEQAKEVLDENVDEAKDAIKNLFGKKKKKGN